MTNEDYQKIFHEIKNNITFINSSLQLVEKTHPEIAEYAYWNDAMQEISALKKMLIELSSARISDQLNLQQVSLESFLSNVADSCRAFCDSADFHCKIELTASLPELLIDPDRLKRALCNLIKNSYEAMNGSGEILLTAHEEEDFIRLDLIDYGGGIPTEYLPKLFTPFETTKADGTGLGLLIARQIIHSHKGQLTVDSRPGDGCTFSIYLPCL